MKDIVHPMKLNFPFYRFVLNEPFIDNTGPSLGSLTVYTRTFQRLGNPVMTQVWRLYNHQGPEWRYAQAAIPETTETMVTSLSFSLTILLCFNRIWIP